MVRTRNPTRVLLPLLTTRIGVGLGAAEGFFTERSTLLLGYVLDAGIIVTMTWLFVGIAPAVEDVIFERVDLDVENNLEARRIRTRVGLLRQMLTAMVAIVGMALVLLLHPAFRVLGTGILASAGAAGIIIGIAAQGPIRNLLAGVQIAITQPIRIDDVVIVEGEWGQIEEITLTYVVLRIWDLRRLIIPIGHFLEKPFQNWTRTSASILGTSFLHVDYSAPVDRIRERLREIAHASPLWDRKVCVLQVTELMERTMELRALVSAASAGEAWDLRCEVREKLITFLQQTHPESLPRLRTEWESPDVQQRPARRHWRSNRFARPELPANRSTSAETRPTSAFRATSPEHTSRSDTGDFAGQTAWRKLWISSSANSRREAQPGRGCIPSSTGACPRPLARGVDEHRVTIVHPRPVMTGGAAGAGERTGVAGSAGYFRLAGGR